MPTYGETRTKFKDRLKRRDCTDALADGFLSDAIKRVQRVLRIPAGEKSVAVTISAATYLTDGRLPIPSDYLQLKDISVNGKTVLKRAPIERVFDQVNYGIQGSSRFYARQGSAWVIGPMPLAGDVVRVDYYSEYASASLPADQTILLNIADDLVVFGALAYACDHFNDKREDKFEARFTQVLSDLEDQGDEDELTGNAAVSQSFTYPPDVF